MTSVACCSGLFAELTACDQSCQEIVGQFARGSQVRTRVGPHRPLAVSTRYVLDAAAAWRKRNLALESFRSGATIALPLAEGPRGLDPSHSSSVELNLKQTLENLAAAQLSSTEPHVKLTQVVERVQSGGFTTSWWWRVLDYGNVEKSTISRHTYANGDAGPVASKEKERIDRAVKAFEAALELERSVRQIYKWYTERLTHDGHLALCKEVLKAAEQVMPERHVRRGGPGVHSTQGRVAAALSREKWDVLAALQPTPFSREAL